MSTPPTKTLTRRELADLAGHNSTHAAPMRNGEREGAYRAQTGRSDLTPKQRRRAAKQGRRNSPPAYAVAA